MKASSSLVDPLLGALMIVPVAVNPFLGGRRLDSTALRGAPMTTSLNLNRCIPIPVHWTRKRMHLEHTGFS